MTGGTGGLGGLVELARGDWGSRVTLFSIPSSCKQWKLCSCSLTEMRTPVTRLVRLWMMWEGGQAVQHCQWLLSLRYNKSWLYKTKQAAGCTALGLSPSYIVFALLQIFASTKDFEVLIVERRDEEENRHFVRSHQLEKMGSESSP